MEATEFLAAAEELLKKTETREVDYRNAASRAYYCQFHTSKQLLERYPPSESQYGTEHEKTIKELVTHQDKRFKKLGNMLKDSKDQRHKADYKLAENFALSTEAEIRRYFPLTPDPSPRGRGAKENRRKFLLQYLSEAKTVIRFAKKLLKDIEDIQTAKR